MNANLSAPLQLDKICRACLKEKNDMKSLYQAYIDKMFNSFVFIQAQSDDHLPSQICSQCVLLCIDAYTFKQQCERSDQTLRESIKFQESVTPIHPKIEADKTCDVIQCIDLTDDLDNDAIKSESVPNPGQSTIKQEHSNNDAEPLQILVREAADDLDSEATESESDSCANSGPQPDREAIEQEQLPETPDCTVRDDIDLIALIDSKLKLNKDRIEQLKNKKMKFKNTADKDKRAQLEAHRTANPPEGHKCEECGTIFPTKVDLNVHLITHPKESHICTVCSKTFADVYDLKQHANTHLDAKQYKCDQCDMIYETNANLIRHKNKHTNELKTINDNPHLCTVCGRKFKRSQKFIKHMKSHNDDNLHKCKYCIEQYSKAESLKIHLRSHNEKRPYSCNKCEKRFTQNVYLQVHIRSHKCDKPVVCSICGKSFSQSSYVRIHMRTHTGVKPYVCRTCGKAYTTGSALKIHARSHTGEKPYQCETCKMGFKNLRALDSHMLAHTGVKPFVCRTCGKGFSLLANMKRHMKRHLVTSSETFTHM